MFHIIFNFSPRNWTFYSSFNKINLVLFLFYFCIYNNINKKNTYIILNKLINIFLKMMMQRFTFFYFQILYVN